MGMLYFCGLKLFYVVPTPSNVNVTVIGAQTVSQSLTLKCSASTVRGITSRVDIVWSSNGSELERIEGANASYITDNLEVYIVSYDILQLTTSDEGRVFQCEVSIDSSPSVISTGNTTLDVNGKS